MAESRIRPENYITVQGWMKTELGLKNNRLLLYALLWGFSQDGKGGYTGRQDYLMEWLDCSRSALDNYTKELMAKGLVVKAANSTGQRILRAIRPVKCPNSGHDVQNMDNGCPNSGHGNAQILDNGCPNSGLPTIYNNIYNNTIIGGGNIDTSVKQPPPPPTVEEIEAYCREIGNGIDAKRFHDYYSLRDWKWREGPITEPEKWQAVLRLWGKDKPKKEDKQEAYCGGSFDTDEFFEAALKNSYGG